MPSPAGSRGTLWSTSPGSAPRGTKRPLVASPGELAADGPANRKKAPKVSRACDACKAKKARCSGTQPCESCVKKVLSCTYVTQYTRGRPPTPPPGQVPVEVPAPTMNYTVDRQQRVSLNSPGPSHATQEAFGLLTSRVRSECAPFANGGIGRESSCATPELEAAEIEGQYIDPTSGLTFLHRAYKRFSTQPGEVTSQLLTGSEKHQPMMSAGDIPCVWDGNVSIRLPPRDVAVEIMEYYFDACVVTYRMFHKQTTQRWLDVMLSNTETKLHPAQGVGYAKAAVVLTIIAIVTYRRAKLQPHSRSDNTEVERLRQSDHYFCMAKSLTDEEKGLPRLESVQARLIQVLYLLQTSRMTQAWYTFGTVCQISSALGLHRRSGKTRNAGSKAAQPDYIASQCRKRVLWVAYTIDAYLSVVLGRPRHLHDDEIDQDFPDCVNDEDMAPQGPKNADAQEDSHLDAVIFHAKLAQHINAISRTVYSIHQDVSPQSRIDAAMRASQSLQQWRTSLPPHLGAVRPSSLAPAFRREATALRLAHSHAVMHASRPFLLGHLSGASGSDRERLVEECIKAAELVLETVDGMATAGGALFHALWWTHYVTFCALAVVYVWEILQSSSSRLPPNGRPCPGRDLSRLIELAERCRSHLASSTAVNSPSRRYSIILEELRSEAKSQSSMRDAAAAARVAGRTEPTVEEQQRQAEDDAGGAGVTATSSGGGQETSFDDSQDNPHLATGLLAGGDVGSLEGMNNLLIGWQMSDWLDLDSSAFAPDADWDLEGSPVMWMPG
ncbi:fungal-specific transcription factor domain-containing protein [Coniochaeta sp. 2T2.1]|nr:fungal-specific transcription factor domain-containing protein [Coniochaeta sp. 2T2.1]